MKLTIKYNSEIEVSEVTFEGHTFYVESEFGTMYRADGSVIRATCTIGRTGKTIRFTAMHYSPKGFIYTNSLGNQGAMGHGFGCHIKRVDWDGSIFEAAEKKASETGKKITFA
jgi:hypothetical protein